MSAAAVLGFVLILGFVGVALFACAAWRSRMRESMPYADWRRAVQDDVAPSSARSRDSRGVARLAVKATESCWPGPRRTSMPRIIRNAHDHTAHFRIRVADHRNHRGS
jgi:hypothetical protein